MGLFNNVIGSLFGDKSTRDLKEAAPLLNKVFEAYETVVPLSNDELRSMSLKLRQTIKDALRSDEDEVKQLKEQAESELIDLSDKEDVYNKIDKIEKEINVKLKNTLLEILPEAFAIMKETARRFKESSDIVVTASDFDRNLAATKNNVEIRGDKAIWKNRWIAGGNETQWDMVHYDVQLIGGIVLHSGKIAEMATGEGKTLVATLPVFLNALSGRGVHLVTVNDYLARRDAEWMGPLYEFHGLSVDCIDKHQPNSEARRKAYMADITFGTNNEFGFDYLLQS